MAINVKNSCNYAWIYGPKGHRNSTKSGLQESAKILLRLSRRSLWVVPRKRFVSLFVPIWESYDFSITHKSHIRAVWCEDSLTFSWSKINPDIFGNSRGEFL